MYATPKVYEDLVVAEPKISMYKVAPVYTDISLPDKEDGVWAQDLQARQDKCLSELELLQQRLGKIEVCADLETLQFTHAPDLVQSNFFKPFVFYWS